MTAQLKAHRVLHNPMKPLRIADNKVRRSEAIREVGDDGQAASLLLDFRTIQVCPKDRLTFARQAPDASNRLRPAVPNCYDRRRHLEGAPMPGMRRRDFVALLGGAAPRGRSRRARSSPRCR